MACIKVKLGQHFVFTSSVWSDNFYLHVGASCLWKVNDTVASRLGAEFSNLVYAVWIIMPHEVWSIFATINTSDNQWQDCTDHIVTGKNKKQQIKKKMKSKENMKIKEILPQKFLIWYILLQILRQSWANLWYQLLFQLWRQLLI